MRLRIVILALLVACAREVRSTNPDLWLELESEHFILRTDLPEEDARRAIEDLELIRNALLAAGWHGDKLESTRIVVVALANKAEVHEFLEEELDGIASTGRFGERVILVHGDGNLLDSEVIKHEVAHALMLDYLVTNPRWVEEGIACLLETLEIDRDKQAAVRGGSSWRRRYWIRHAEISRVNWSLDVMGMGAALENWNGYEYETLSWGLVHWLVDTDAQGFDLFLARLAHGEGMWTAFAAAFPALTEEQIAPAMKSYLYSDSALKARFSISPWSGTAAVRKIDRAEVHALRAELFSQFGNQPGGSRSEHELALAKAADPANPLLLALSSDKTDLKLAVVVHPEDWRSWLIWFEANHDDIAAIRKAAELAPTNGRVLALLALAEQNEGHSKEAIELAQRAATVAPGTFVLHSLAAIYAQNGRCGEATWEEERAIAALPDRVDPKVPASLRERLKLITDTCGKDDSNGTPARTVEVEPVLKTCRQPLLARTRTGPGISVQFTIREDGSVTAVAVQGARNAKDAGVLRQFVESCSFEPVIVEGKPRRVQVDLALENFLRQR